MGRGADSISIHALLAESDAYPIYYDVEYEISIHALLAESDLGHLWPVGRSRISIHALLAESDWPPPLALSQTSYFYPRSPCGERRLLCAPPSGWRNYFYPRSPCGERHAASVDDLKQTRISIHALLAESDPTCGQPYSGRLISIHALLAESDQCTDAGLTRAADFYPRSPCGERPLIVNEARSILEISIHALLAESDTLRQLQSALRRYFYPRSPCGERLRGWTLNINGPIFLSTLSLRRATLPQIRKRENVLFLSTLSLRRATGLICVFARCIIISIHALLAESDLLISSLSIFRQISIHALLAESDCNGFA